MSAPEPFLRALLKQVMAWDGAITLTPEGLVVEDAPPGLVPALQAYATALRQLVEAEGVPEVSEVERAVYRDGTWMPPERE